MTRIPVSIVTGFLGAGKTTFLNRLIATGALDKAALVINEFGDIGIDHLLIETAEEGIVELSGGCLCCSLRGDLADTLFRLVERDPVPDRIVIETTGLADPGPIAQTVIANSELNQRLELAGVLALIDCEDGPDLLEAHDEARRQIAMADRILMTKGNVKEPVSGLESMLREINLVAPVMDAVSDDLSVVWLNRVVAKSGGILEDPTASLRGGRRSGADPGGGKQAGFGHPHPIPAAQAPQGQATGLAPSSGRPQGGGGEKPGHQLLTSHAHQTDIRAIALSSSHPIPLPVIELFLETLRQTCGKDLLRVKGLVRTVQTPQSPLLIQGVGQSFDTPRCLPHWPRCNTDTRLVIIGRNLDEQTIRHLFDSLTGKPITDIPDRQALEESPLSVPGFF